MKMPEGLPFPGAMRRNADETATEDAPAGMIEADAAIERPVGPSDAEIEAAAAEMDANKAAEENASDNADKIENAPTDSDKEG